MPHARRDARATTKDDTLLLARARHAQRLRETMTALLPGNLFLDPAWDMMLELVVAGAEGRMPCVKELVAVSGESATSALRRLDRLQASGLIRRTLDPADHRRVRVELTEAGRRGMAGMLGHMFAPDHGGDRRPQPPPHSFAPQHPRD